MSWSAAQRHRLPFTCLEVAPWVDLANHCPGPPFSVRYRLNNENSAGVGRPMRHSRLQKCAAVYGLLKAMWLARHELWAACHHGATNDRQVSFWIAFTGMGVLGWGRHANR